MPCDTEMVWYLSSEYPCSSLIFDNEICTGILLEYLDGEPLSQQYVLDENGETLPFAERVSRYSFSTGLHTFLTSF